MALLRYSKRSYCGWEPSNYTVDEISPVFAVNPGDVVGGAFMYITEAFNGGGADATLELGDAADRNGYMTTANTACTSTGLKQGTGAYLTECPGHLYTVADTIDINCITDTSNFGTAGICDAYIYVADVDPH